MFLKEFVILFGFLNGVWLAVGVNPGAELLGVLQGIAERLVSGRLVAFLFTAIPIALTVGVLYLILRKGGWVGFLAVLCGFFAGLHVISSPTRMALLLVLALALGFVATKR